MRNDMITKALAGSLLVAASMSANADTSTITTTFVLLPDVTIAEVIPWVPTAVLTGAAASTCTWTPTIVAPTLAAPAAADVTIERTGDGCPVLAAGTAGTAALTGTYTLTAATAPNVDVNVNLAQGTGGDLTFDPAGVAIANDGSTTATVIPTGTPTTVNLGPNGIAYLYAGGTTTVGATGLSADQAVDWVITTSY